MLVSRSNRAIPQRNSWAGDLAETAFNLAKTLTADMQSQGPIEGYVTLSCSEKVADGSPEPAPAVDNGGRDCDQIETEPFWWVT